MTDAAAPRPLVVCHPVHQHAYQTALAAQRCGLLESFWTGVYRTGRGLTGERLLARMPRRLRVAAERELGRRWEPGLDPALVRTVTVYDAANVAWRRLLGARAADLWDFEPWMLRRFDAAVAARLRRRPLTVVHAFEGAALSTLAATRRAGGATVLDCPSPHERFVAVCRANGEARRRHPTERIRAERVLADRLLAPSEQVVDCLVQNGVPAEKIVHLPYGADPERFASHRERRGEAPFRALFVGRIEARKGIRELLSAWRLAALPDAELVLLGSPGHRARELLRGAPRGVCWHGPVPRNELPGWYEASDMFVFPSLAEGSALVTYEAMAAGLASVVTAEAGSVVRHGRDGFVVPAANAESLAERLIQLHDQPRLREDMGHSARAAIEQRWTWRDYGRRLTAVWLDLLGRDQPASA
jgi:glycosyltransferase involved in cell wall biosynthesis